MLMTPARTWHRADEATIAAANSAMRQIAESDMDAREKVARIEMIWRPVAEALTAAIRPDLPTASPAAWELAKSLGPDFLGQTTDTGRIVSWGEATVFYRPFVVRDTP